MTRSGSNEEVSGTDAPWPEGAVRSVRSVRTAGQEGVSRARIEAPFVRSVISVSSDDSSNKLTTPPKRLTSNNDTSNTSNTDPLEGVRDGDWLSAQSFSPLLFAVPGILPAGFTVLAGPPKAGKSWLVLDWLIALSMGMRALGSIDTGQPRHVFYLALEDSDRRMQARCDYLLQGRRLPPTFHYKTHCEPHLVMGLMESFLDRYPDTGLIVVDTLGKVMPPQMSGETTYQRDYRVGGALQALTIDRPGLSLVVNHHTRKSVSTDFVDSVSGTNGLAGAADTIIVLTRDRSESEGKLEVTGRDVEEGEYAIVSENGRWKLEGADLADAAAIAQERKEVNNLGGTSKLILDYVTEYPEGAKSKDVADKFGAKAHTYLKRLVESGHLDKVERGLYVAVAQS